MKEKEVTPRLLTVKQAAQYLNVAPRTLYNKSAPGAKDPFPIRPTRIGRSLRFDRRDLDSYIDQQKTHG